MTSEPKIAKGIMQAVYVRARDRLLLEKAKAAAAGSGTNLSRLVMELLGAYVAAHEEVARRPRRVKRK